MSDITVRTTAANGTMHSDMDPIEDADIEIQ